MDLCARTLGQQTPGLAVRTGVAGGEWLGSGGCFCGVQMGTENVPEASPGEMMSVSIQGKFLNGVNMGTPLRRHAGKPGNAQKDAFLHVKAIL